jgi:hypothetical protein
MDLKAYHTLGVSKGVAARAETIAVGLVNLRAVALAGDVCREGRGFEFGTTRPVVDR